MPQAKLKAKVQIPSASKKKSVQKKPNLKRKAGRVIAPKKAKLVASNKLKKKVVMTDNKVSRPDDDDDSSSGGQQEEMLIEDGEEINIEFEGFPLSDRDSDGIRQLLVQQFNSDQGISISKLADALIRQNFVGTILKQSEMPSIELGSDTSSDMDDVFALVTCYSLTRHKEEITSTIHQYLTTKCKSSSAPVKTKEQMLDLIQSSSNEEDPQKCSTCLGLILNERYVNVPPQASLPMFNKLIDELVEARKKKHRPRFDFTHYVMLTKTLGFSGALLGNSTNDGGGAAVFQNAEEELFADEALFHFDYRVTSLSDDVTCSTRRALVLNRDGFGRAMSKLREHLA